jgi:peptidoglycan/LPS O-acetylase OafA/YrhL
MEIKPPTHKLLHLDSLRGLAALAVVCGHLLLAFYPGMPGVTYASDPPTGLVGLLRLNSLYMGHFSVMIFFVLSGFVLSYSFFVSGKQSTLTSAATRRYFRLAIPVLTAVLFVFVLVKAHVMHEIEASKLRVVPAGTPEFNEGWLTRYHVANVTLKQTLRQGLFETFFAYDEQKSLNSALWTMSLELQGSFLIYASLALFGRLKQRWLILGILAVILFMRGEMFLVCFMAGMALSGFHVSRGGASLFPWWLAIPMIFAGIYFGAQTQALSVRHIPSFFRGADVWVSFGATITVLAVVFSAALKRLLELQPFHFLGRISFSLYLLHLPLIYSLGCFVFIKTRTHGMGSFPAFAWSAAATIISSMILAALMTLFVDEPAMDKIKQLYNKYFQPIPATSPKV